MESRQCRAQGLDLCRGNSLRNRALQERRDGGKPIRRCEDMAAVPAGQLAWAGKTGRGDPFEIKRLVF